MKTIASCFPQLERLLCVNLNITSHGVVYFLTENLNNIAVWKGLWHFRYNYAANTNPQLVEEMVTGESHYRIWQEWDVLPETITEEVKHTEAESRRDTSALSSISLCQLINNSDSLLLMWEWHECHCFPLLTKTTDFFLSALPFQRVGFSSCWLKWKKEKLQTLSERPLHKLFKVSMVTAARFLWEISCVIFYCFAPVIAAVRTN